MTALFLDCGNTRTKYSFQNNVGVFESLENIETFVSRNVIKDIWLSDVAGHAQQITRLCEPLDVVCHQVSVIDNLNNLKLSYEKVSSLGVDRWLAMQAVWARFPKCNLVVVDIGTAVKIDVINQDGQHVGGSISPGLRLSNQALFSNTSQLPEVQYKFNGKLGTSTEACINYGLFMSIVAMIEHTVLHFAPDSHVIVTGGDSKLVSPFLTINYQEEANLVLKGLKVIEASKQV